MLAEAAGSTLADVKVTAYLSGDNRFAEFDEAYAAFFSVPRRPARLSRRVCAR